MTWEKLNSYRHIKSMIRTNEENLAELEARLQPGIMKIDGMPRSGNNSKSMIEDFVPKIIELKGIIHKQNMDLIDLQIEIEQYIERVPDLYDKNILKLRFITGLSWRQVAYRIGGGNTGDSVRMRAIRIVNTIE